MYLHRLRFPVALLVGVFCLTVFGAQSASAFSVSPVIVDLDISPGKSTQGSVQIFNNSETSQTYYVSIQNFVARGEEGQQDFLPETDKSGLATWIVPEVGSVTLGPNEGKEFKYAVNIPEKAEPGGHYAAMFFSTQPETDAENASVGVGAKTGILYLLKVPGDIREDARVESFTSNASFRNRLPAYLQVRIRNLGNIHFRPEGEIAVKSMLGTTSARIPMNPLRATVLPNSIRRVDAVWAYTFDEPKGGFFTEVKNEWRNFAIGRYTAELNATYGASKQPLNGKVTFWIFPWHLAIVAGALLILLLLVLKGYNSLIVGSAIKKAAAKK